MTVLDINKPKKYIPTDKIHPIYHPDDILIAILDTLIEYPNAEIICVDFKFQYSIVEIAGKLGFEVYTGCKGLGYIELKFRGYHRWVYYLNDEPVYFSSSGCMTETPAHLCGFSEKIFETLEWDRYEKVYI